MREGFSCAVLCHKHPCHTLQAAGWVSLPPGHPSSNSRAQAQAPKGHLQGGLGRSLQPLRQASCVHLRELPGAQEPGRAHSGHQPVNSKGGQ